MQTKLNISNPHLPNCLNQIGKGELSNSDLNLLGKIDVRAIKWLNPQKFNAEVDKWGYSIPDGVAATKQKRFPLTGWPEFRTPTPFFCHKTAKQGRKQVNPICSRIYSLFSRCKSQGKASRMVVCRKFGRVGVSVQ